MKNDSIQIYKDPTFQELVAEHLRGKSDLTRKAYQQGVNSFATWLGVEGPDHVIQFLVTNPPHRVHHTLDRYRNDLTTCERPDGQVGYSTNTVNRRLAALRSLGKFAKRAGLIGFDLDVRGERVSRVRDVRGPQKADWQRMVDKYASAEKPKDLRDWAMIRLMHDRGLRQHEVLGIDFPEHVDLESGRVNVRRKKRKDAERQWIGLAASTVQALRTWVAARGSSAGPLFCSMRTPSKRLGPKEGYEAVRAAGLGASVRIVSPHRLRHLAITEVVEATNGDVSQTAAFSGHSDVRTVMEYVDEWRDTGRELSERIA